MLKTHKTGEGIIIISIVFFSLLLLMAIIYFLPYGDATIISGLAVGETNQTKTTPLLNIFYSFIIFLSPLLLAGLFAYNHFGTSPHKTNHTKTATKITKDDNLPHHSYKTNHTKTTTAQEGIDINSFMINKHIKSRLVGGNSIEEIKQELTQHNWKEEKVSQLIKDLKLTRKEADLVLGTCITRALIAGNSLNDIRQNLIQKGWEPNQVDNVIDIISK